MNADLSSFLVASKTARWRIVVTVLAAVLMLVISELAYQSQHSQLQAVSTMTEARSLQAYVMRRIADAESGKRGYMLVDGSAYLEPYNQARRDVRYALGEIRKLDAAAGDPALNTLQTAFEALVDEKLQEMETVLKEYDGGRTQAALDIVRTGIGREIMQRLRDNHEANMTARKERIDFALKNNQDLLLLGRIGIGAMTLLCVLILVMFIRQGHLLLREREQQRHTLQDERDRLQQAVKDQLSELKDLARHLQNAREDERARLARDLHDELGALLTTAKLDVAVIRPQVQQQLPELSPRVNHLITALNDGIALKRRIIEDLCPSSLRSLGLVAALEALLSEVQAASGLDIAASLNSVPLTADNQLTAYRLVQESLTNALKYAEATRMTVRMLEDHGMALIEVCDNGQGFDPSKTQHGSHGIQGMRFRLEAADGRLHIHSQPGEGTRVQAWLPLSASSDTAAS